MNTRSDSLKTRRHAAAMEALIEAAEAAITRFGYERVTMRDIAAQGGCSAGTLYLYFKDKHDVLAAIITRHGEKMFATLKETLASSKDPVEKIRLGVAVPLEHFNKDRPFFRLLYTASSGQPEKMLPKLPASVQKGRELVRKMFLDAIGEAQAQGRLRRDFPPETIWKFINGTILGFMNELSERDTIPSKEEQMRVLWGFLFSGIGAEEKVHATS